MKGIMYHYVRKREDSLPYFTYLDIDNFECQLDYFIDNYNVVTREEFEISIATGIPQENSVVLTFDDGLAEHYHYVRPALSRRGLWGIFYVSTKPYSDLKLLDVHRVHYLLGYLGGEQLLSMVMPRVRDEMIFEERRRRIGDIAYAKQNNGSSSGYVKKLLNYFLRQKYKEEMLDSIMSEVVQNEEELSMKFYLSPSQINEMIDDGFAIGCHAHSHSFLPNLSDQQQSFEIEQSTDILRTITEGRVFPWFCFPYGGYNKTTLRLLEKNGYELGFGVNSRDIQSSDLLKSRFELPRYDCNEFPYGNAVIEGAVQTSPPIFRGDRK